MGFKFLAILFIVSFHLISAYVILSSNVVSEKIAGVSMSRNKRQATTQAPFPFNIINQIFNPAAAQGAASAAQGAATAAEGAVVGKVVSMLPFPWNFLLG